jgi:lysozyme family protein
VNTGIRQAAKFLQRAVDAEDERRIGPLTLRAREESLWRERPARLAERLVEKRAPFYESWVKGDTGQQMFLKGWVNRVK